MGRLGLLAFAASSPNQGRKERQVLIFLYAFARAVSETAIETPNLMNIFIRELKANFKSLIIWGFIVILLILEGTFELDF